ncbi:MAG: bifunctional metallophosphatase/5'-nucleotidase [Prevotella sp.]|nr:bifunctional metallophosphatase/5'-nucleotidase [Prevotella sp.]
MIQAKTVTLRIVETSDVHGSFFPYDFITGQPRGGSLAKVSSYVNHLRKTYGDGLILLENGDILQGQPICYYYNYLNRQSKNVAAEIVNYLRYDAQTVGNHDIETGHAVYDKWTGELNCPVLGANVIDTRTGKPYLKPYTILHRQGVKIAVLGLLTPAIPNWLSKELWSGLRFEEMVSSARKWMGHLKRTEKPDVVIGLFHCGRDGGITTPEYAENAAMQIAKEVPGFSLVLYGHDHTRQQERIRNAAGEEVLCLDPGNNAMAVADAAIQLTKRKGKWHVMSVEGQLVDMTDQKTDEAYMDHFKEHIAQTEAFVNRTIGESRHTISTRDSYFGSSAFNDLILNLELKITGADIAFNAPLSFDASIRQGPITVADMFKLYKYENQLYVMRLTGREIRDHLEMSYDLWVNTMKSPEDHLLLLSEQTRGDQQRLGFRNLSFNFDSAAGIDYVVDVTKPDGQKVKILQMSNGQPFHEEQWYRVAINSYRGNGGGELLTRGAGILKDSLEGRIVWRSERDQRYYLMEEIERAGVIDPQPNNNWKFVPEEWVKPAAERDNRILYHRQQ